MKKRKIRAVTPLKVIQGHRGRYQSNEPYLPLLSQPKLVLIYRLRRDGRLSWPWVAGWLHTEISVRHRELNPDKVAHLSTNRAGRRLTSLIEANALTTTPDHQQMTHLPHTTYYIVLMCRTLSALFYVQLRFVSLCLCCCCWCIKLTVNDDEMTQT